MHINIIGGLVTRDFVRFAANLGEEFQFFSKLIFITGWRGRP